MIFLTFLLKKTNRLGIFVGRAAWIFLSTYFLFEYIVIRETITPYSILKQPMSDLGVTACGNDTYVLATYEICSPYHPLMNITFTLIGVAIFVGAILLQPLLPKLRRIRIATVLFAIYGISFAISGIIPADISFTAHTISALPGMVVQIPALFFIAQSIKFTMPKFYKWTLFILIVNSSTIVLLCLQAFITSLPGGLLQRILYGSIFVWMIVTAIVLQMRINK
nr:DUF998 domain-containing protein [Gracilibacillus halotolerans]